MSTRPGGSRQPANRNVEGALEPRIQVKEKGRRTIENYPSDIVRQLERAAFSEGDTANTYVKHVTPTNDSEDSKVATVEIRDEGLVIDVEDIVGIVNLTPNATLQIDPKIGWGEILNMYLETGKHRRSIEYRGIPIRDFLADDIGIEDVFIVVALNYLDSLDAIFRHGLIRSFREERRQSLDGRGRIDIEKSLLNFHLPNGIPRHEFVEKTVEYSIPVNDVIYRAGKELVRLFHLYASSAPSGSYRQIFSRLERAVRQLEQRGITGKSISLRDVSQITRDDIPRQRYYYADALQVSKTILSSMIGQPLDQGREELLMEYIIGMESLFESYVSLALEEEVDSLRSAPFVSGLEDVSVGKESHQIFENCDLTFQNQPDHVIRDGEAPVAILDSKYYAKDKNPLEGSWARSRLLSYGFQLQTDQLGMVAPLATPGHFDFKDRPGSLHIVAPEEESFTTEGIHRAIDRFLRSTIAEEEEIPVMDDLKRRPVCHPDVNSSALEQIVSSPSLQSDTIGSEAMAILKYATTDRRLSNEVNPRGTPYLAPLQAFRKYLQRISEDYDVVIPFFIPSGDPEAERIRTDEKILEKNSDLGDSEEFVRVYCLNTDDSGAPIACDMPAPYGLSW